MALVTLPLLLVLILGRGLAVTMWLSSSVTFFPASLTIAQGLSQVSRSVLELPCANGKPSCIRIPSSMRACGGLGALCRALQDQDDWQHQERGPAGQPERILKRQHAGLCGDKPRHDLRPLG